MGHQQGRARLAPLFLRGVIHFLHQGNAGFFRQPPHGIRKAQVFHLHHEGDGGSPFPAAEAFEVLPGLVHDEGRRLLIMERAARLPPGPGPFQGKIGTHHIYNVSGFQNATDAVFINPSHKARPVYHSPAGCTRRQNQDAIYRKTGRGNNRARTGKTEERPCSSGKQGEMARRHPASPSARNAFPH